MEESGDETAEQPRSRRRLSRRTRRVVIVLALLLGVATFASWLGYEATQAKSNLEQARDNAQKAKEALVKGNPADAGKWVDEARSDAQRANDATHSLPWNLAAVVPWLGSPLKSGQQISDVALSLTTDVLQPAVHIGVGISPDHVLNDSGQLDVRSLRAASPQLAEISTAAANLDSQAKAIAEPAYLAAVRDARTALQQQISQLSGILTDTSLAAQLVPAMMGADGPRSYFMGFQTNAEARGSGGLLGGFGIIRFDNGAPSVEALGPNTELNKPFTPIDLGPEYTSQYGFMDPTTDFRNSNQSAHFPYTAQIWKSMWEQQSGTKVDGVISIDPVALSYILGAVGPVNMADGETISSDNVVELTESTAYLRFGADNTARKAYLQNIAGAVVKKMTGHLSSPRQLLDALGKAVGEGRIAIWSASPAEQQLLEKTPLAHEVPDDPAPYAGVVINNLGGNKLDYYLTRQITYSAEGCDSPTRKSTVTVRLTNGVPDAPLPDYVVGSSGLLGGPVNVPDGTNVTSVALLATTNAKLTGATIDGAKAPVYKGRERGHPIYEIQLAIVRGRSVELKFELSEPTSPGAPRVPIQPLVDTVVPTISVPTCSG